MDRGLVQNPSWVVTETLQKMETVNKSIAQQLPELSLEEELASLECMPHLPSVENLTYILRKCRKHKNPAYSLRLHAYLRNCGLEAHKSLGNYLVPMLVEVGSMHDAQQVFDRLVDRNEYSWTSLITGYIDCGEVQHAFILHQKMLEASVHPSGHTYMALLQGCAKLKDIERGQKLHAEIARKGLLKRDPFVANTLVDMYAKCGLLAKAQEVFDKLPVRDAVSWNALIAGYAEHDLGQDALNCFEQMQLEGLFPTPVTFVCILKACGSTGAIDKGQEIHAQIARKGFLERNHFVGNALVDMYAKFGLLAKAREVLDKLPVRDAVSWTALIKGYAQLGESENVFLMFDRMRAEDIKPDGVTFLTILTVCCHTGLVAKGQTYFEAMSKDYGITPTIGHYNCMVDLLGRAGQLDKAVVMTKKMPLNPTLVVWLTLLGACRKWENVVLGRWVFEHAVELDKKDSAPYVLMSNIYADAHLQEEAKQVELMRLKEQAWVKPGQCWWSDDGSVVHSFLVGDTGHSQSDFIYAKLVDLSFRMKEEGFEQDLHWLSHDISDDVKESELCWHSEKLAIACALINTPKGETIHIVKNLRVCRDCHFATAFISKVEQRTILLKDANRFHVFNNGKCSCGDYG